MQKQYNKQVANNYFKQYQAYKARQVEINEYNNLMRSIDNEDQTTAKISFLRPSAEQFSTLLIARWFVQSNG